MAKIFCDLGVCRSIYLFIFYLTRSARNIFENGLFGFNKSNPNIALAIF